MFYDADWHYDLKSPPNNWVLLKLHFSFGHPIFSKDCGNTRNRFVETLSEMSFDSRKDI